jgi:hypothetical protein
VGGLAILGKVQLFGKMIVACEGYYICKARQTPGIS